jgi:hypothetical protein
MKRLTVPVIGGILIGLLNLIHYYISPTVSILHQHFAISVGGFWATTMAAVEKSVLGKNVLFLGLPTFFRILIPGIVVGAFLTTVITNRGFTITRPSKKDALGAVVGGIMIGFGILLGNGCVIKHLLSGVPVLSLSSIVSVAGIILGLWLGLKFIERWWY